MIVGVCGSRGFKNPALVREALLMTNPEGFVSGGASGPDNIAEIVAKERDIPIVVHRPNYAKHGKAAPFVRNTQIAQECDTLIAFWDGTSGGTLDTIRKAIKAGKPVLIYPPNGVLLEYGL